jgi:sugar phosphate isomerase/epimerase
MQTLIEELNGVSVNFDPANIILYGMGDPVQALEHLAPHVTQIHVKDAVASAEPGEWGTEMPVGEGDIDWPSFIAAARALPRTVSFLIEREAGDDRIADVRTARHVIDSHIGAAND